MICSFAYVFSKDLPIFYQSLANRNPFSWEVAASMIIYMISVHSAWTAIQYIVQFACVVQVACTFTFILSYLCVYALEYYIHVHRLCYTYVVCKCAICLGVDSDSWILLPNFMWLYFLWLSRLHGLKLGQFFHGELSSQPPTSPWSWWWFGSGTNPKWSNQMYPCTLATRRWWQQIFVFLFSTLPTWGRFPIWRAYFADGLVQPLTS